MRLGAAGRLGFTLIEMILTLVVLGIIAAAIGAFILPAVQGYVAQTRRAALVDSAENALRRISRDIRIALPNSVRVTRDLVSANGFALELIPTADGGRYCVASFADANCLFRQFVTGTDPNLGLGGDADFDILGCFRNPAFIAAASAAGGTSLYRLVINNRTPADVYAAAGANTVITPLPTTIRLTVSPGTGGTPGVCGSASADNGYPNLHHINIAGGYDFDQHSPRRRLYVIENASAPVTYVCDTTSGTLSRYAGYGLQAVQPNAPGAAPLVPAGRVLVAENVSGCEATDTVAIQGTGLVTLDLSVTSAGETVRLVHQVQLDNSQ